MKVLWQTCLRMLRTWRNPSGSANLGLLQRRGETPSSLLLREAVPADIPALAELHAKTWSDTYPRVIHPPTAHTRARQWKEKFALTDDSLCCFVIENSAGRLIGFASGERRNEVQLPEFTGHLSKIYLLREYQRMGLGGKLMKRVVDWLLERDITTMILFADPGNPSCRFYEMLGGEKLLNDKGEFHGAYGWRNLREQFTLRR